jgi:hypothetical protein
MEKKTEVDREAAREGFLASDPLYHCFFYSGWERGAAKVALRGKSSMGQEKITKEIVNCSG